MSEKDVIAQLFEASYATFRERAACMLRDRVEAEDVVQDAFVRALSHEADARAGLHAWVYTIVSHLAIDRLRHRKRWSVRNVRKE